MSGDQQTGNAEIDIVGNAAQPSFYIQYDDGDQGGGTNAWLGFRFRLGADSNPEGFSFAAYVGLDANLDEKLDLFVGVNNQDNGDYIGVWSPGSGLNESPMTTSVDDTPIRSYIETAAIYSLAAVSSTTDPSAQSYDLNVDQKTDQFLSFFVPLPDVLDALVDLGFDTFTTDSPMALVAATATQGNRLNGDLNGVTGGTSSRQSWSQLGAFSETSTFETFALIPEPSPEAFSPLAGSLALFWLFRHRRRA